MIVPCPNCGDVFNTEWVRLPYHYAVMCWEVCGMDFDVSTTWVILNSIDEDDNIILWAGEEE